MELGYWGIKGVAEPIRWLAAYLGSDIKEYTPATPEEWFGAKKAQVGGDFPNLPYLADGDYRLTESSAIPVYLILKAGKQELIGADAKEQGRVRQIEGVLSDIRQNCMKILFAPADQLAVAQKTFEPNGQTMQKIEQLSKFLGEKEYFLGHLTYADIIFAYTADISGAIAVSLGLPCPYCGFENLSKLKDRVHGLNGIKQRFESSKDVPFMPPQMVPFPLFTTAQCEAQKPKA